MQDLPMQDLLVESKSLTVDGSVAGSLPSRLPPQKGGLAKW